MSDKSECEGVNESTSPQLDPVDGIAVIRWALWSAATTVLFLSVTNMITVEVAPMPLLWVIPLSIYLLSFVLAFQPRPFGENFFRKSLPIGLTLSIFLYFNIPARVVPFPIYLLLLFLALFLLCMFCQGELYRERPSSPRQLTLFYVIIALGGFLGGMLVNWVIPLISTSLMEFLIGLWLISWAMLMGKEKHDLNPISFRISIYLILFMIIWPLVMKGYTFWGWLFCWGIFFSVFRSFQAKPYSLNLCLASIMVLSPTLQICWSRSQNDLQFRNYYGIYKIYQDGKTRLLVHSSTLHGAESLDPKYKNEPLTYYARTTPIGELLSSSKVQFSKIAVVGLGTGTLAAYLKAGQEMDFYELDPDVLALAQKHFTFLKNSKGNLNFIIGDARLGLQQSERKYDLIVIDAFSGDAVPVHLLAQEAIEIYRRRLNSEGILVFHISNRYMNLAPVLFANAERMDAWAGSKSNPQVGLALASLWVGIFWNEEKTSMFQELKWQGWVKPRARMSAANQNRKVETAKRWLRPWTDQYSYILSVINLEEIKNQIKGFRLLSWPPQWNVFNL